LYVKWSNQQLLQPGVPLFLESQLRCVQFESLKRRSLRPQLQESPSSLPFSLISQAFKKKEQINDMNEFV
jgi:hypothetical protein